MDGSGTRLDGNACAGLLFEVFGSDITAAVGACAGCGAVGEVGRMHLYGYPDGPGTVLRCPKCDTVLVVVVRRDRGHRLATPGLAWVDLAGEA